MHYDSRGELWVFLASSLASKLARRSYCRTHVLDNLTDTENREDSACLLFFLFVLCWSSLKIVVRYWRYMKNMEDFRTNDLNEEELSRAKILCFNLLLSLTMYEVIFRNETF